VGSPLACNAPHSKPSDSRPSAPYAAVDGLIAFKKLIRDKTIVDGCSVYRAAGNDPRFADRISPQYRNSIRPLDPTTCAVSDTAWGGTPRLILQQITFEKSSATIIAEFNEGEYVHDERYHLEAVTEDSRRPEYRVERMEWGNFVSFTPPPIGPRPPIAGDTALR
jgi:hypothetical protein